MRRFLPVLAMLLLCHGLAQARGLLLPQDKTVPPLAMVNHKVQIAIDDQVAITRVDQTFRNHTGRPLEATYVFPVPKGASVNKFTMWIDGKETKGELVEAAKARQIYTEIVRRTYDPGLLEYMGTDLLQMKVFPVPANGDQQRGPELHRRPGPGTRSRRVCLSPQDRRQIDGDPGNLVHRGHSQIAARRAERVQPHARHFPQADG